LASLKCIFSFMRARWVPTVLTSMWNITATAEVPRPLPINVPLQGNQ
jgi:hypothetical protein